MREPGRPHIRRTRLPRAAIRRTAVCACALIAAGCTSSGATDDPTVRQRSSSVGSSSAGPSSVGPSSAAAAPGGGTIGTAARKPGVYTMAFAGDVHFEGRIGTRLAIDPATVFAQAAPGLRRADLTMVNLETAITTGGEPQPKLFTFRAPPSALTALRDAGVDVATMANNHGADYGSSGIRDSLAAIRSAKLPVVGIGANSDAAFAPYRTTLRGMRVAIFAADQVQDETTLRVFSAGPAQPGVANAYDPRLVDEVRKARRDGYVVVVYVHWGIEYQTCPSSDQMTLAGRLADAGASAIIGTHAHVLQGAGWRTDGAYVAYGLGNYLWWRSFGNNQDDNGVLTLTFNHDRVTGAQFAPSRLDDRGVPVPATGAEDTRISAEFAADRDCADLAATPPRQH